METRDVEFEHEFLIIRIREYLILFLALDDLAWVLLISSLSIALEK